MTRWKQTWKRSEVIPDSTIRSLAWKKKNPAPSHASHLFISFPAVPSFLPFVIAPVFIALLQSLKLTLLLSPALSVCDFAVEAFCCEGVCGGFWSISWIYSSKSKAFFTSLSLLATNVCVCGRVLHYLSKVFHFSSEAEGCDNSSSAMIRPDWRRPPHTENLPFFPPLCAAAALNTGFPLKCFFFLFTTSHVHRFPLPLHPPAKSPQRNP